MSNIKKLQLINEFLTEQMNHWLLFPLALLICVYARRTTDYTGFLPILMWMLCSILPLAFFILRLRAKSFASFLILHPVVALLPVGAAIFLTDEAMSGPEHIISFVCAVCYMFHSVLLYLKKEDPFTDTMPLSAGVAVSAVCMLFETTSGADMTVWTSYHIFPLIVSLGLFFIILYIQRYIDFLNVNKSSAGYLPAAAMFRSGFGLALGYTVFGIAVMAAIACVPWLGQLGSAIVRFLKELLKWIIAKFRGTPSEKAPVNDEFETMPGEFPGFQVKEAFWLWKVLEYVCLFAMFILLLIILVKVIIRVIQYLQGLAMSRMGGPELDDGDAFDIHEKCDMDDRRDKKDRKRFGPFSYSDKIRRLYKRRLLSTAGRMTPAENKMLGIYTAREWEQKLSTQGMASVYEQARYSGQEMTAEDVKRMKDACR